MSETRPARHRPTIVIRRLAVVPQLRAPTPAALASGFITGDAGPLTPHSANAILLVRTSVALPPATIPLVRPDDGPWWPRA